jgi:hypothetical protein
LARLTATFVHEMRHVHDVVNMLNLVNIKDQNFRGVLIRETDRIPDNRCVHNFDSFTLREQAKILNKSPEAVGRKQFGV